MTETYTTRSGYTVNLTQFPRRIAPVLYQLSANRMNSLSKRDLLIEAEFRNLDYTNARSKTDIIRGLLEYYRFNQMTPIQEYRFTDPVARLVAQAARESIFDLQREGLQDIQAQARIQQENIQRRAELPPIVQPARLVPLPLINIRGPTGPTGPAPRIGPVGFPPLPAITSPMTGLPPITSPMTGLPPRVSPMTGLPPLPPIASPMPGITAALPPLPKGIGFPKLRSPTTFEYTLDNIYNISNTTEARDIYRHLVNDPNAGAGRGLDRLKNQIIIEAYNKKYLSHNDYNIHTSRSMEMLRNFAKTSQLLNLIDRYNLRNRINIGDTKDKMALVLYRNGVNFSDVMYAVSDAVSYTHLTLPTTPYV